MSCIEFEITTKWIQSMSKNDGDSTWSFIPLDTPHVKMYEPLIISKKIHWIKHHKIQHNEDIHITPVSILNITIMICMVINIGMEIEHALQSPSAGAKKKQLNNLNFQLLQVVSRYCDPQLQVAENTKKIQERGTWSIGSTPAYQAMLCMRPRFELRWSCVGFSEKYPCFPPFNVTRRSC